jgi:hypothetical protein
MIGNGFTKVNNDEKGANKVKMKRIDLQKKFCSANNKKVPRAYESLNPALHVANGDKDGQR